jgi:hypothetical protein
MTFKEAKTATIEMHHKSIEISRTNNSIKDIPKFMNTMDLVAKHVLEIIGLMFKNGNLVKLNLFNIFIYIKFAKLSYNFVLELLEIWKREDKAQI